MDKRNYKCFTTTVYLFYGRRLCAQSGFLSFLAQVCRIVNRSEIPDMIHFNRPGGDAGRSTQAEQDIVG
jgi:hypothetical protein